jgi:hypothetical protein
MSEMPYYIPTSKRGLNSSLLFPVRLSAGLSITLSRIWNLCEGVVLTLSRLTVRSQRVLNLFHGLQVRCDLIPRCHAWSVTDLTGLHLMFISPSWCSIAASRCCRGATFGATVMNGGTVAHRAKQRAFSTPLFGASVNRCARNRARGV